MKEFQDYWKAWLGPAAQWPGLTGGGEQAPASGPGDTVVRVSEQIAASQRQLMTLFMNPFASQATPGAQSNSAFAPFQAIVDAWLPSGGATPAGGFGENMEKWREMGAKFLQPLAASPWGMALKPWMEAAGQVTSGLPAAMPNFGIGDVAKTFAAHPALIGNPQSLERLTQKAFQSALEVQRASAEYQLAIAKGWQTAFTRFAAEFQDSGSESTQEIKTLDEFLRLWARVGERALQENARSEEFLVAQARMIRTAMAYRIDQRQVIEAMARMNDLPTQTDLDEAFKMIHELRREVRRLRQQRKERKPPARRPHARSRKENK